MTQAIIEVRDLHKPYPGVNAVNGIDFAVPLGICFGLLGSNGAGKTTTIEMMEGITKPISGEIFYKGESQGGTISAGSRYPISINRLAGFPYGA